MDSIHLGKHDRREHCILVAVMVIFKREDGYIMHLLLIVNLTSSGIRICMWLERLVALLKEEGKNNSPAFFDIEVYIFYVAAI